MLLGVDILAREDASLRQGENEYEHRRRGGRCWGRYGLSGSRFRVLDRGRGKVVVVVPREMAAETSRYGAKSGALELL